MKKRICLTVDEDVYEGLKNVPRGVSVSEMVSWILRGLIEEVTPGGRSPEEFVKFMDNDPRGKEVRQHIKKTLGPIINPVFDKVDEIADGIKTKIRPKKKVRNV
jgi:hypothetical protein